jgi:hypothetical protein
MAELIDIANAMFRKRSDWDNITGEDKEKFFFIFNRYFSKKYPDKAQLLNIKSISKVDSMDLWFHFMKDKPYPQWFWSKSPYKKLNKKLPIPDKDYKMIQSRLKLRNDDLDYLIENHIDAIKEEIKYYKKLDKQ